LLSLQFSFNPLTKSHLEVKEESKKVLECSRMEAGGKQTERVNMEEVRGYLYPSPQN
jgi:hypothetical protein